MFYLISWILVGIVLILWFGELCEAPATLEEWPIVLMSATIGPLMLIAIFGRMISRSKWWKANRDRSIIAILKELWEDFLISRYFKGN
jgi:hypothetical protein